MSWDFKSVAIVGSGAIGLYYGGRLAQAGEDVRFLLRSDFEEISKNGLTVRSSHGDFELPTVRAFRSSEEIGPVDLVIVCWKATANGALKKVLPPLLHENTQILTLQNGLGNCEAIAEVAGEDRVLGGLCFVCINRIAQGVVSHTAGGQIKVGTFDGTRHERADLIASRFKAANIPCGATDNLARAQWEKLIWNVPFNGLAVAEGGVTTDVLLADPAIETEIRRLMKEVVDAANAQGLGVEENLIDWNIDRTRQMAAYKPSTMIDFVEGRELELGPIWEEPLRRAQAAGVPTPAMESLLSRMQERVAARQQG
jgi:2-dehydropantoate 2-reductase